MLRIQTTQKQGEKETWGITHLDMYSCSRIHFGNLITGKININHHQRSYNVMYHVVNSTTEQ